MDRKIIVQVYQSTNGNKWDCRDGWDDNNPALGSWFGVKTNDVGRVVELNLDSNNLRGKKSVTYKETVFGTCVALSTTCYPCFETIPPGHLLQSSFFKIS